MFAHQKSVSPESINLLKEMDDFFEESDKNKIVNSDKKISFIEKEKLRSCQGCFSLFNSQEQKDQEHKTPRSCFSFPKLF